LVAGPVLATAAYLALITALANASGIAYLLFPELGALGSVVFSDPRGSWARSPLLLALTPFLTALPGVLITRSLPYGPLAVFLDVAVCLLVIGALRSPIVPALSAGVLPLALGITSWQYPLAILAGTGGLALLVILRPKLAMGWRGALGPKPLGDPAGLMSPDAPIAFPAAGRSSAAKSLMASLTLTSTDRLPRTSRSISSTPARLETEASRARADSDAASRLEIASARFILRRPVVAQTRIGECSLQRRHLETLRLQPLES
jgi:hypothetical protein